MSKEGYLQTKVRELEDKLIEAYKVKDFNTYEKLAKDYSFEFNNPKRYDKLIQVYRTGNPIFRHRMVGVSDEVPVYEARWRIEYAIPKDPSAYRIIPDGTANPSKFA